MNSLQVDSLYILYTQLSQIFNTIPFFHGLFEAKSVLNLRACVLQIDLFINFDCDLQSINLYERTAKALSQLAEFGDSRALPGQSALVRDAAIVLG